MQKQKYFIAILPAPSLASEITTFRKKHLDGLNDKIEYKKFPHITLQHTFSREEKFESQGRPYLRSLAESFQSFEIKLSGVNHFDRRVLFIEVEENPLLLKLHQDLINVLMDDLKFTAKEVAVNYHPHLTLEKKISKPDFSFYWNKIQDEKFQGEFQCNSFSLMKHNGMVWEETERFDLIG